MDLPVDALFDTFGPFLVPAVLFVAGAVGYGVLLLVTRLLASGETVEWQTEPTETDEATDTDRRGG